MEENERLMEIFLEYCELNQKRIKLQDELFEVRDLMQQVKQKAVYNLIKADFTSCLNVNWNQMGKAIHWKEQD